MFFSWVDYSVFESIKCTDLVQIQHDALSKYNYKSVRKCKKRFSIEFIAAVMHINQTSHG